MQANGILKPGRRGVLWLAAVLWVVGGSTLAVALGGSLDYRAGLRNSSGGFATLTVALPIAAIWLACCFGQVALLAYFLARPTRSGTRFVAGVLCLLTFAWGPIIGLLRVLPGDSYVLGFGRWTQADVDARAIRAWCAAQPPVTVATPVPAAAWPPSIASLAPAGVVLLPGNAGVVLEWGRLAAWGDSRKVCILATPATAPPAEYHYQWVSVAPGIHVAQQDPG